MKTYAVADFSTKLLTHTHTQTHLSQGPFSSPHPSPLSSRVILLSFLPASPSLIGELQHISDWPVLSAPPLVSIYENTSLFWGTLLLSLRSASSSVSPPLLRCSSSSTTRELECESASSWTTCFAMNVMRFKDSFYVALNTTKDECPWRKALYWLKIE